jgi:hypothetical protein
MALTTEQEATVLQMINKFKDGRRLTGLTEGQEELLLQLIRLSKREAGKRTSGCRNEKFL